MKGVGRNLWTCTGWCPRCTRASAQVVENVRQIGKMERESQDCVRRTEELARKPFAQKIQKARADLGGLNQEIARMEAGA